MRHMHMHIIIIIIMLALSFFMVCFLLSSKIKIVFLTMVES